ncbi:hypothetical protein Aperf_G00000125204 [Anoplocephala perfoliata]
MVLGERSDGRIDREKTCPLLLRIFVSQIYHNKVHEYSRKSHPSNELRAYTWLDATLLELSDLIKSVHTDTHKTGTVFDFAIVSPDPRSNGYRMRNIGSICSGIPADSDKIMLKDCTFRIGDMLDVSITPASLNPSVPANDIRLGLPVASGGNNRRVVRRNEEPSGANTLVDQSTRRMSGGGGSGGRDRYRPYTSSSSNSRQRRNFI